MNLLIKVMKKIAETKAQEEDMREAAMYKKVERSTMQLIKHYGQYKTINLLKKKYPYLRGMK